MTEEPLVSIVFRSRNEGKSLITLLPLLYAQRTIFPYEVILQENTSTDQTSQIIKYYPQLKVVNIPYGQFHPSKTTMEGAKIARGEILVHLSAHCFPSSFFWLQNLVQLLINDPTLIATYGREFANPNVNAYQELDYSQLFSPKTGEPKIKTFSNANGAIRKNYLLEHPFDENVTSMEDHLWFLETPDKSKIVYVPEAEVLHLHPLFNLKYYLARWQRGGQAMFYISQIKNLASPLADPKLFSELLSVKRIMSFFKISFVLFRQGLFLYALMAPVFYLLRDWSWKKGLIEGKKRFTPPNSNHQNANNLNLQQTNLDSFKVFYLNKKELEATYQEIFTNEEYQVSISKLCPSIVDCGSNIGLSILYFKKLFPQSKILGFEPHPLNFEILKKNIEVNQLSDVTILNLALAQNNGTTTLFSDARQDNIWTCQSTIVADFSANHNNANTTKVSTTKLSSYLTEPVDLLKMDIEGAELEVLQEIEPVLRNVGQIVFEYHGLLKTKVNRFSDVLRIIKRNFSEVAVLDKKNAPKTWRWKLFKKTGLPLFRIKNPYHYIIKAKGNL